MMDLESSDPWVLKICEQFDSLCDKVDVKINKVQKELEACKKKSELDLKMSQELKLNEEITARLAEATKHVDQMDHICASFKSRLTVADSDMNRLDNVKDMYELGKDLTGIRFDFSAPPNIAKGYIKCERRKLLEPFELNSETSSDEILWKILKTAHCD